MSKIFGFVGVNKEKVPYKVKLFVRKRFNYRCYCCNTKESKNRRLTIHHIRPRSFGGSNHVRNLVLLCWNCHQEVHKRINARSALSFDTPDGFFYDVVERLRFERLEVEESGTYAVPEWRINPMEEPLMRLKND